MPIRHASSLIVKRGDAVYLAHRSPQLRFFGDFWAFPGGAVTEKDREFAQSVPGLAESGPYRVALAREMLEELGLWLEGGTLGHPDKQAERDQLRQDVLKDESSFYPSIDRSAFGQSTSFLRQIAHLLTPAYHPIRFDTFFFLLDLDGLGSANVGEPDIWPGELVEGIFDTPENWIQRWRRSEVRIAAPVLLLLETVCRLGWERAWSELAELSTTLGEGQIHTIFYNPAAQLFPVLTRTRPPATHTNAILIGQDPAYLVDPGSDDRIEQDRLIAAVEEALSAGLVTERRLRAILLTHHHPDHVGGATRLAEHFGVPIWAHEETAGRLRGRVDVTPTPQGEIAVRSDSPARSDAAEQRAFYLRAGQELPLGTAPDGSPDWALEVHFTPGHAPGHLCFYERRYRTLLVGDLVSTISSILIGEEDGDMIEYLDSLRRMADLDPDLVCPAHGPAATKGTRVIEKQIEHRRAREQSVIEAMREGAGTSRTITETVYGDVPREAWPLAEVSVRSILRKLEVEDVVRRAETGFELVER